MALFFSNSGSGDFLPIIKYDARAGRLIRKDGFGDAGVERDITDNFSAVFDMEAIEVGWMAFSAGKPDFRLVPLSQAEANGFPPRPEGAEFKQGFRVRMKLNKDVAGEAAVREFTHSSALVRNAFDQLHDAYLSAGKHGQLPIVKMAGVEPIKSRTPQGTTTNYKPRFQIVGWVDRPDDLKPNGLGSADPSTGPTLKSPPTQAARPVPAGEDDFG